MLHLARDIAPGTAILHNADATRGVALRPCRFLASIWRCQIQVTQVVRRTGMFGR